MLEKWKVILDKGKSCGDLLTDLSKVFDCVAHDLLIAEFHAYSFDDMSLQLIYNYLSDRKQRIKINSFYINWTNVTCGFP